MILRTPQDYHAYREAGRITTDIMMQLRDTTKPGLYPIELDELAGNLCKENHVQPAFRGVKHIGLTYHHNSCISVNDEILHGIPSDKRLLAPGDLVKLDFGIIHKGFYTDNCITVGLDKVSSTDHHLLEVGRTAVFKAATKAIAGNRTGDLGFTIHKTATRAGYDVLKQYIGHGIGTTLHDDPEIPAWGKKDRGAILKEGMIICVEAQVMAATDQIYIDANGWTVKTVDGSKGVMFEYLLIVGKDQPEILTPTMDWPLVV